MKALLGIVTFEGTLLTIVGHRPQGGRAGDGCRRRSGRCDDPGGRAPADRMGRAWLMLALGLVNIVLAIWRPRLSRRRAAAN